MICLFSAVPTFVKKGTVRTNLCSTGLSCRYFLGNLCKFKIFMEKKAETFPLGSIDKKAYFSFLSQMYV